MASNDANANAEPKKPLTPGARLAAEKAAKSARKAAQRGKQAEQVEDKALKQASVASDWLKERRTPILGGLIVVVVAVAGFFVWSATQASRAHEAADQLDDALEVANGVIVTEGETPPKPDDDAPTFTSVEARAEQAAAEFDKVAKGHSGTPAATWALLGEGNARLELGKAKDARDAFQAALDGTEDPLLRLLATEGLGASYEVEKKWDEARKTYESIRRIEGGAFSTTGNYHIARVYTAEGKTAEAKEALKKAYDELKKSEEGEGPERMYTRSQVEARLAEIDPSLVPRRSSGMGGGGFGGAGGIGSDFSPEELQRLIRQLQEQQGGAPAE